MTASRCPWCGKGEQSSGWWLCNSWQSQDGSRQSAECAAYCEGRRQGHLEALREVEKIQDENPAYYLASKCAQLARKRLARKRWSK